MSAPVSVMVVDDDPAVRSLLLRMLEKDGFRVLLATDGLNALSALENFPADIVVSDMSMPGMDGLDLLREVRRRRPDAKTLLITGNGSQLTAETALESGADGYLEKPFKQSTIVSALRGLLRDRRAAEQR